MKPLKFKSVHTSDELIIVSKDIFRIMEIKDMVWGDNQADGKVYEYQYNVIFNGELSMLDEHELAEALENMKFIDE